MLSTTGFIILLVCSWLVGAGLGIAAVLIARSARNYAASCVDWLKESRKTSPEHAKIAQMSAELTELTDAYDALLKSHRTLRSRITMRENREKKRDNEPEGSLESTDKKALRIAAKSAGLLK